MMFVKIKSAWSILTKSIKFMFKKPLCLIPFIFAIVLNTILVVYIQLNVALETLSNSALFGLLFLIVFIETFITSIASLILLELLEQYETDGDMRFGKAVGDALTRDLFRSLPIIIGWSIIQFILMLLEAVFSGDSENRRKSFVSRFFKTLQRGVRMGAMLIMSAIAWEDISPSKAYAKGKYVYKKYFVELASSFGLIPLFNIFLLIPLILIIIIISFTGVPLGVWFIYVMIIYFTLTYSAGLLLEQLFAAELYLWYRVYEKERDQTKIEGHDSPSNLYDVKKPSFFDDIPSFATKDYHNDKENELDY